MSKKEFIKRMKEEGYKVVTFWQDSDKSIIANVVSGLSVYEVYVNKDATYATLQHLSSVCVHDELEITDFIIKIKE